MKNYPINNYYPLSFELKDGNERSTKPQTTNLHVEELLRWSIDKGLNALQVVALIMKNAFEGHICVMNGVPVEDIVEQGTGYVDFNADKKFGDLTESFSENLHLFREGFETAWEMLVKHDPALQKVEYGVLESYILAFQLFMLPVSCLKGMDPEIFSDVSEYRKKQLGFHQDLNGSLIKHVACWEYIEMVDESYYEKFKDLILKLESRQNTLMHLKTKLEFANDPEIRSEDELNEQYFKYLVYRDQTENERKTIKLRASMEEVDENKKLHASLNARLKSLYRSISKNCREVHTQTDGGSEYPELKKNFMTASNIYHNLSPGIANQLLQYQRLLLMLFRIINYRKTNGLPVDFHDFTGWCDGKTIHLNEEEVPKYNHDLDTNLNIIMEMHGIRQKVRYIQDEELASIHREYLGRQQEFIDNHLKDIMNEIKEAMQNKMKFKDL